MTFVRDYLLKSLFEAYSHWYAHFEVGVLYCEIEELQVWSGNLT